MQSLRSASEVVAGPEAVGPVVELTVAEGPLESLVKDTTKEAADRTIARSMPAEASAVRRRPAGLRGGNGAGGYPIGPALTGGCTPPPPYGGGA